MCVCARSRVRAQNSACWHSTIALHTSRPCLIHPTTCLLRTCHPRLLVIPHQSGSQFVCEHVGSGCLHSAQLLGSLFFLRLMSTHRLFVPNFSAFLCIFILHLDASFLSYSHNGCFLSPKFHTPETGGRRQSSLIVLPEVSRKLPDFR